MIRFESLFEKVRAYSPPGTDLEPLRRAYVFSALEHKGQVRHSGEPYLVHPLEVADILAEMKLDVVAVAAGHHKRTMFTLDERLGLARELCQPYPNVEVVDFRGLLRDFVVQRGGKVVVRGLRAVSDFEYEFQMAGMNRQLMPDVETVFLTPSDQYQFVSGTFVREIASLGGDVSKFVAPSVLDRLSARVARRAV